MSRVTFTSGVAILGVYSLNSVMCYDCIEGRFG